MSNEVPVDKHGLLQAKSEVYVGKLRQQLCFLPGLPWLQMGVWILPEESLQALATSVRRAQHPSSACLCPE